MFKTSQVSAATIRIAAITTTTMTTLTVVGHVGCWKLGRALVGVVGAGVGNGFGRPATVCAGADVVSGWVGAHG
ncbi:hypothetical protein, partial [Nocardia kruczakiae]|uniref:hypothetical protein n=1 Tax=Nocardia kruczakiae TaxID=261477 RepID=UPI00286D5574